MLLCTIMHCVFCPITAAVQHRGTLLYAVGLDSKYCMLWGGGELPGVQLLGSVSWPFLPHLPWHPGSVDAQPKAGSVTAVFTAASRIKSRPS